MLEVAASMFSRAKILEFLAPGDIVSGQSLHLVALMEKYLIIGLHNNMEEKEKMI